MIAHRPSVGTFRSASARIAGAWAAVPLVASSAGGQACPCEKRDLATTVERADVIFAGKPLAATTDSGTQARQPDVPYQERFAFDVATVLKGSTARVTTVVTPTGPCGAGFVVGGDDLVVGTRQGDTVFTDACQGNAAGTAAIGVRAAAIRTTLAPPASSPAPTKAR